MKKRERPTQKTEKKTKKQRRTKKRYVAPERPKQARMGRKKQSGESLGKQEKVQGATGRKKGGMEQTYEELGWETGIRIYRG